MPCGRSGSDAASRHLARMPPAARSRRGRGRSSPGAKVLAKPLAGQSHREAAARSRTQIAIEFEAENRTRRRAAPAFAGRAQVLRYFTAIRQQLETILTYPNAAARLEEFRALSAVTRGGSAPSSATRSHRPTASRRFSQATFAEGVPGLGKTICESSRAYRPRAPARAVYPTYAGGHSWHAHVGEFTVPACPFRARPRFCQCAARGRDQPRHAEDAVSPARSDAGARGQHRRRTARGAAAVLRPRDAKPDRDGGHLPAARGAARPLLFQSARPISKLDARGDSKRTSGFTEPVLAEIQLARAMDVRTAHTLPVPTVTAYPHLVSSRRIQIPTARRCGPAREKATRSSPYGASPRVLQSLGAPRAASACSRPHRRVRRDVRRVAPPGCGIVWILKFRGPARGYCMRSSRIIRNSRARALRREE